MATGLVPAPLATPDAGSTDFLRTVYGNQTYDPENNIYTQGAQYYVPTAAGGFQDPRFLNQNIGGMTFTDALNSGQAALPNVDYSRWGGGQNQSLAAYLNQLGIGPQEAQQFLTMAGVDPTVAAQTQATLGALKGQQSVNAVPTRFEAAYPYLTGALATAGLAGSAFGGDAATGTATGTAVNPEVSAGYGTVGSSVAPSVSISAGDAAAAAAAAGGGGATPSGTTGATGATGTSAASNTALQRILAGTGTSADWLQLGGQVAPSLLSALGSYQQANAQQGLADKYLQMGAPYRDQLAQLQTPEGVNAYMNSAQVQGPLQQGTNALARALSTQGNPAGSGGALTAIQDYATNNLYGQLFNRQNQLANFGGLSQFNAAAPGAATGAIGATGKVYGDVGYGLGQVFNPQPNLSDLLKQINSQRSLA